MQRILVVEDDFDIQELLQNFLQEAGYEVAVANDGVEALSLFAGERLPFSSCMVVTKPRGLQSMR